MSSNTFGSVWLAVFRRPKFANIDFFLQCLNYRGRKYVILTDHNLEDVIFRILESFPCQVLLALLARINLDKQITHLLSRTTNLKD